MFGHARYYPHIVVARVTPSTSARSVEEAKAYYDDAEETLTAKIKEIEIVAKDVNNVLTKEQIHQLLNIVSRTQKVRNAVMEFREFFDNRPDTVYPSSSQLIVSAYPDSVIFEPEAHLMMNDRYERYGNFFQTLSMVLSPSVDPEVNATNLRLFSESANELRSRLTPTSGQQFCSVMASLLFAMGAGCGVMLACLYPVIAMGGGAALTVTTAACSAAFMLLGGLFAGISGHYSIKFAKRSCNFFANKVDDVSTEIISDLNQSTLQAVPR